jgi:Alkylmercury lyase
MNTGDSATQDWQIRAFVYRHFAEETSAPSMEETAKAFRIEVDEAEAALRRLHDRHALYFDSESHTVRMANPFSGIPTSFIVRANGRAYYANCAWDALGIPAALHADAMVETACAESQERVELRIVGDEVIGRREIIHFSLPVRRWYEDLVFT